MSHGSIVGYCVECGYPAMYQCEFCGAKLCNTHKPTHACQPIAKTADAIIAEITRSDSSYKTKVAEPEKKVDGRRKRG
jgi:methionyl-tRNA synthetase